MNLRRKAAEFLQNVADYIYPDKPPLLIPDRLTGENHIVTSPDKQKAYNNLNRYVKKHLPNFVVVMCRDDNGEFQPNAMSINATYLAEDVTNYDFINTTQPKPR